LRERHANVACVQVIRTVVAPDSAVRANLVAALTGPGAPAGIASCVERDDLVRVTFDDAITAAELVDDLITIETHFVADAGSEALGDEEAARLASVGLVDPGLDAARILERHLVGLE
jgi:hypothetical protein